MKTKENLREFTEFLRDDLELNLEQRREFSDNVEAEVSDFELGNYRFIRFHDIEDIMVDELSSDAYILGCFNDYFLAGILDVPVEVIQTLQTHDSYEAIGEWLIQQDLVPELVDNYVLADGYQHFAHYDGTWDDLNDYYDCPYYSFRIN